MRSWLVAGGLLQGPDGVLLVENRRRGGHIDWSPPGGVVDQGETALEALTREVFEETGISVTDWVGPCYVVNADAPDLGWTLYVEVYQAVRHEGRIEVGRDPDGIVAAARFMDRDQCAIHLASAPQWVAEPVMEWLSSPWESCRSFEYEVLGSSLASLSVTRLGVTGSAELRTADPGSW